MSREMHQLDDEPNPRQSRFSFESQEPEPEPERVRREASIDFGEAVYSETRTPETSGGGHTSRREAHPEGAPRSKQVSGRGRLFAQGISSVIGVGVITATLFSLWMPGSLMPGNLQNRMAQAANPARQRRLLHSGSLAIGFPSQKNRIVVGHRGSDSGAVCSNGLTELEVNSNVATFAQMKLIDMGYEWNFWMNLTPLEGLPGGLLFSIHATPAINQRLGDRLQSGCSPLGNQVRKLHQACAMYR
jgi:N-acetylmuramoyl-L-alanine amidase